MLTLEREVCRLGKNKVMEDNEYNNMSDQLPTTQHLEPRVAKLEAGLDILTKNVTDLTSAVRDNANNLEGKLERLTIAVTQAQAPKKTDWSTIFAGIMLVLAIGSAVFWPLNQVTKDNKLSIEKYHESMVAHQKMDNHPVGATLLQKLEDEIKTHIANNEKELEKYVNKSEKEFESVKASNHEEIESNRKLTEEKLNKIQNQINKLSSLNDINYKNDKEELQMWRQKAMGLNIPSSKVN